MKITVATVRIKPEKARLYEETFHELKAKVVKNEPGTLFFELSRDPDDGSLYRVFEAYRDAEAIQAHVVTDYYNETAKVFLECLQGDHLTQARQQGLAAPREIYKIVNSLRLDRYETI